MGSQHPPAAYALSIPDRLDFIDSQLLEMQLVQNALVLSVPHPDRFLHRLQADIDAWSRRASFAAHTTAAITAHERLSSHIRLLREEIAAQSADSRHPGEP